MAFTFGVWFLSIFPPLTCIVMSSSESENSTPDSAMSLILRITVPLKLPSLRYHALKIVVGRATGSFAKAVSADSLPNIFPEIAQKVDSVFLLSFVIVSSR